MNPIEKVTVKAAPSSAPDDDEGHLLADRAIVNIDFGVGKAWVGGTAIPTIQVLDRLDRHIILEIPITDIFRIEHDPKYIHSSSGKHAQAKSTIIPSKPLFGRSNREKILFKMSRESHAEWKRELDKVHAYVARYPHNALDSNTMAQQVRILGPSTSVTSPVAPTSIAAGKQNRDDEAKEEKKVNRKLKSASQPLKMKKAADGSRVATTTKCRRTLLFGDDSDEEDAVNLSKKKTVDSMPPPPNKSKKRNRKSSLSNGSTTDDYLSDEIQETQDPYPKDNSQDF